MANVELSQELLTGGAAVGGAWVLKECFAFFLKLRKQDNDNEERTYKPEEHWRCYVTKQFEEISAKFNQMFTQHEIMKGQVLQLQFDILKKGAEQNA